MEEGALILRSSDTLDLAVTKIGGGHAGAASVLGEVVLNCRHIDPNVDHPFAILMQLDRLRITGVHLWNLYNAVCDCNLIKMLALLRAVSMRLVKPAALRATITRKMGGLTPPWANPINVEQTCALVKAEYPRFGWDGLPRAS